MCNLKIIYSFFCVCTSSKNLHLTLIMEFHMYEGFENQLYFCFQIDFLFDSLYGYWLKLTFLSSLSLILWNYQKRKKGRMDKWDCGYTSSTSRQDLVPSSFLYWFYLTWLHRLLTFWVTGGYLDGKHLIYWKSFFLKQNFHLPMDFIMSYIFAKIKKMCKLFNLCKKFSSLLKKIVIVHYFSKINFWIHVLFLTILKRWKS